MSIKQTVAKRLSYLGAAVWEGQQKRGVERGPQLVRNSGVFDMLRQSHGVSVKDYGDIASLPEDLTRYPPVQHPARNLNILGPVLGRLHDKVQEILMEKENELLLTVGGDHSIAAGTISAVRKVYQNIRVVWIDAHPDISNPGLRNAGKIHVDKPHGMPLSLLTGISSIPQLPYWSWLQSFPLLDPRNVVLIAIREIDKDEKEALPKSGIKAFTMDHVDKYGIGEVMKKAIEHLDPHNKHPFHISFDVDAINPDILKQTGTRFRYGLSGREAMHVVRRLSHERRVVSMDLVEINPSMEEQQEIRQPYGGEDMLKPMSNTVGLGVDLTTSLFHDYLTL